MKLSRTLLKSHGDIGLFCGAVLLLLCITGSISLFAPQLELWQQPSLPNYQNLTDQQIQTAFDDYQARIGGDANVFVILPSAEQPRAHLSADGQEWWLQPDGTLGEPIGADWIAMVLELHTHLHLPQTYGLIVVGLFAVALVALIVSGVIAHTRIFKDAFHFRWGRNPLQMQIDLHNRLSVWGLPFHLMFAITGAFFGLVNLLFLAAVMLFYNGDQQAAISDIYGGDPVIEKPAATLDVPAAMTHFRQFEPTGKVAYLKRQNPNSDQQILEIAATLPGRLIFTENYRYHSDGSYLGQQGMANGPISRQVIYSVYRLHFGSFGGTPVRWLYLLLGIALSVIALTGVNIWLLKRNMQDRLDRYWAAAVWGQPIALALAAVTALAGFGPWLGVSAGIFAVIAVTWRHQSLMPLKQQLALLCAVTLAMVPLYHWLSYPPMPQTLGINLFWLACAAAALLFYRHYRHRQADHNQPTGSVETQVNL